MSNPFTGYRITSPFGYRIHPITKQKAFHTGVDLVKSHKAPIHAFTDGVVTHSQHGKTGSGFGGYGNVVAIRDRKGCLHVYAHLDSMSVKLGYQVKKGQVIGYQGNTGNSTGSHLHYEIRKTSTPKYGWTTDRENNCYHPATYLNHFDVIPFGGKTIKKGMRGNEVKLIQEKLGVVVDGIFGVKTETAVKNFQRSNNLVIDGLVGRKTWAKLFE